MWRGTGGAWRMGRRGVWRILAIATLACALGGCANLHPTRTGFLDHYEQLTPTSDRLNWGAGRHRIEVAPPSVGDLAAIDSFFIEPVRWLAREDDWMGPNDWRRDSVTKALDTALRNKLGKVRPIVATPGPKTARVRAAVTDVVATRAITNWIVSWVTWVCVSNGGAAVEVEVRAPDGRRIAAVDGASMGGCLDYLGYYLWSSHARTATRRLAGELEHALSTVTAIPPP